MVRVATGNGQGKINEFLKVRECYFESGKSDVLKKSSKIKIMMPLS